MDNKDKISVFKELFKITKSSFANLKSIGLSSSTGRITNKTLYLDKANFISQSVTGLFSKESKWDGEQ